ncbi:MAG: acyl carrier protein [Gemmataceae bacterium]
MSADRESIRKTLGEFLEAETDIDPGRLVDDSSLRDELGLDSIDLVSIIMRIEGHYKIRLAHQEMEKVATVSDFLDLIETKVCDLEEGEAEAA